jgi:carbonic anhydrase
VGQYALKRLGQYLLKQVGQFTPKWVGQYGVRLSQKRYDRLVELNVKEQAINVIKMAAVQRAIRKRGMQIHGWVFDIKTGRLIDLEIDFRKTLEGVMEIYRLED